MHDIYALGITPSTTEEAEMTDCKNVLTQTVSPDVESCSINNLDNAGLMTYFHNNCANRKECDINLSSFIKEDPFSICS